MQSVNTKMNLRSIGHMTSKLLTFDIFKNSLKIMRDEN